MFVCQRPNVFLVLNLVVSVLMDPPFEPLPLCLFLHLTAKGTTLAAITSSRRVGELNALVTNPPYSVLPRQGLAETSPQIPLEYGVPFQVELVCLPTRFLPKIAYA